MALDIATFKTQIHAFLEQIQDKAIAEVGDSDLPMVGALTHAASDFLFQELEDTDP